MATQSQLAARSTQAARLAATAGRPRFVHLAAEIWVHDENDTGERCPCCGSEYAAVAEKIRDAEAVIDLETGRRVNREGTHEQVETFDAFAAQVHQIPVIFRCSRKQLPLLLDEDHKVIAAVGSARSGKTTVGVYWLARQWIKNGGRGAQFWLVAHQRQQTHTLMEKLLLGEFAAGETPPVLPLDAAGRPMFAKRWPTTVMSPDQTIEMIDGSKIMLKHASKKGGNLKGKAVQAILLDEATEVAHRENWTILLSRLTGSKGSMFVSTTPLRGHWLKEELIDRVDAKMVSTMVYTEFSMVDNPWLPQDEVQRLIETIGDELTIMEEIHGKWISGQGSLWKHFDSDRHVVDGDSYDVADYIEGAKNVTKIAQMKFWRGRNPYTQRSMSKNPSYVAGQDFNTDYMNVVVAQIFEFADGRRGLFVVDEVVLRNATSSKMARWIGEMRERRTRMRCYPNVPIACDATGAYYSVHQVSSSRGSSTDAKDMALGGFDCRPCRVNPKTKKPQNPPVHDRVSLMHKLFREGRLIIHSRCADLIKSLQTQADDGRGRPVKKSNTASDRLSGPTDACGYLVWPLFSSEYETRGRGYVGEEKRSLLST